MGQKNDQNGTVCQKKFPQLLITEYSFHQLMQQNIRTMGLFGAIIAIASGLTGVYAAEIFVSDGDQPLLLNSGDFLGHVTMTVRDANGNVNEYRQFDNVITNLGEDCATSLLFGQNGTGWSGTNTCSETRSFNVIAIGNGTASTSAFTEASTELFTEHNHTATGFQRAADGDVVLTAATAGTPAQAVISNEFQLAIPASYAPGTTSLDVTESGLFNSTTAVAGAGMFAGQSFTAVTVDDTESLTVEWTINLGGTVTIEDGAEEG